MCKNNTHGACKELLASRSGLEDNYIGQLRDDSIVGRLGYK